MVIGLMNKKEQRRCHRNLGKYLQITTDFFLLRCYDLRPSFPALCITADG